MVPSTWLETGPLTVLEAFAAGLPVAGSDLGGIKELLQGVEGCFRLPLEAEAWANFLAALMQDPKPLTHAQIPKPSQYSDLALALDPLYCIPSPLP